MGYLIFFCLVILLVFGATAFRAMQKQREAEIFFLFRESVKTKRATRYVKLTDEEISYRNGLIQQLRDTRKTYAEAM